MSEAINFTFDGRPLTAKLGQTLAAALLANGITLVGRSFKLHRPRGILSAGVEEPNALVTVGRGGREEPNTRATDVFVYEGLAARTQNRWPGLAFDAASILGLAAKALPAGFYYKTFFGSPKMWLFYEHFIRRAAGLGPAPTEADPDRYAQRAAFCDVLVVGGGPAGLIAARDAARAGRKVILVEQDAALAPSLLRDPQHIEGTPGPAWAEAAAAEVRAAGGRAMTRTTASGHWDDNLVCLSEKVVEPGERPADGLAQRYWHVRAGEVVLATGAIERPMTFADNDRPGVMLSQALRTYVNRFGVRPARRVILATTNDDAYLTANALRNAGAEVVAVLDTRPAPAGQGSGFTVFNDAHPVAAHGGRAKLTAVTASVAGAERRVSADLLAVSGGFSPVVHLHMQAGGTLGWDAAAEAFVPRASRQNVRTVGLAAKPGASQGFGSAGEAKRAFVDFQNDVTVADLDLAWREGYRSVEHLKRYTTLGMATDQGKTANMAALDRIARREAIPLPEAGITTFRPPYTPVSMGALAGASAGARALPTRLLALHHLHHTKHPIWLNAGYWKRPRAYPVGGETLAEAGLREARCVRRAAGMCDVSSLAKFEVQGPDAAAFLERVCATNVKLKVGRGRYTFMLREDGMVFDDGTVWRLGEDRWFLTSSTGGAARMATWLSYIRNHLCADLRVSVQDVQEHFGGIAVAGPKAAAVLAELTGEPVPTHMGARESAICGVPVRLLAASFSGERAFEIHAPATALQAVWNAIETPLLAAGGCLYGLEAMELLRIEKGHMVVGPDIDGRLTPHELGLGRMVNKTGGYIGEACLARPDLADPMRKQLVGLVAVNGEAIPEGSMLVPKIGAPAEGHVTGAGRRVLDSGGIAIGHLKGGHSRIGETVWAHSPTRKVSVRVRVSSPHFYDPAGDRYRD